MTAPLALRVARAGLDWIVPMWDAPPSVHALSTTRNGGVSTGARASLDLGAAKPLPDPERASVLENRRRLLPFLPAAPVWISQVHGAGIVCVDQANVAAMRSSPPAADALVTRASGIALGVRAADCLPVLFADRGGTVIGAAHAGWRGLAAGVLEATVGAMGAAPHDIVAWLGPAIGPQKFEVGRDVLDAFVASDPAAASCFVPHGTTKWHADLYGLARRRLRPMGVATVAGGNHCTVTEEQRFFSFRRDKTEARMATLIWLDPVPETL
jgi:polyphenol oxidase